MRGTLARLLIGCGLFLMLIQPVMAQEDLPDLNAIFANPQEVKFQFITDREARIIYYYQDGWQSIPYPEGANELVAAPVESEMRDLVVERQRDENGVYSYRLWKLGDGNLTPYEPLCGEAGLYWLGYLLSEGRRSGDGWQMWNLYRQAHYERVLRWVPVERDGQIYPCSMETGELQLPTPQGMYWGPSDVTPDGEWILLWQYQTAYASGTRWLYGFEMATGKLNSLGRYSNLSSITYFEGWITDTQFLIYTRDMPEWSIAYGDTGDVTIPNSVGTVISRERFFPVQYEDHLESYFGLVMDGPQDADCFLRVYEFQTRTSYSYDTGSLCDEGLIIPGGNGARLYRGIAPGNALVRFNPTSGERQNLFMGEIESIHDISPDGRYVILTLDSNMIVDIPQDRDPISNAGPLAPHDYIFDLESNQMVYALVNESSRAIASEEFLSSTWLDADHLLIVSWQGADRLLTIDSDEFSETPLPGQVLLVMGETLLMQTEDGSISFYNWQNGNSRLFMLPHSDEDYRLSFAVFWDGQLLGEIYYRESGQYINFLVSPTTR